MDSKGLADSLSSQCKSGAQAEHQTRHVWKWGAPVLLPCIGSCSGVPLQRSGNKFKGGKNPSVLSDHPGDTGMGSCLIARREKQPASFVTEIPAVISLECAIWLRLSPSRIPACRQNPKESQMGFWEIAYKEPAKSCSDGRGACPESQAAPSSPQTATANTATPGRGPWSLTPFLLILGP